MHGGHADYYARNVRPYLSSGFPFVYLGDYLVYLYLFYLST